MSTHADWWDKPNSGNGDTPVIRHASDPSQYEVPEYDMLGKMRGSKVGRFAVVPEGNRDGTSKGFDANIAGLVHVDPDAPDGGVIFNPHAVSKQDINKAISHAHYPHQVFYALGQAAPSLGVGRMAQRPMTEEPRVNERMPGSYVVPKAAGDGSQVTPAAYVGNGATTPLYNPLYQPVQEDQRMAAPHPMNLPPLQPAGFQQPPPPPQQVPQYPQLQQPPQQPQYPPQYQQAPLPQFQQQPPALDPMLVSTLNQLAQGMAHLQQELMALKQPALNYHGTTGMSNVPLPRGTPPLATVPGGSQPRGGPNAYNENFDDTTARPIHQQVRRDKRTQDIVEEDSDPVPRRRVVGNSMVEQEERQTVAQYEAQNRDNPRDGVITGFETLNLNFVSGPVANKAKRVVYFDIPGAGKHQARYHDVIDSKHCVVLVYDTRYEEGTQYLPPSDKPEAKLILTVPHLKTDFVVRSMGLQYNFGVFDHVVLVKDDEAGESVDSTEGR